MLKQNKIFLLWLFIAMLIFFSCGDVADPSIAEQSTEITDFKFVKVRKVSSYDGKFEAFHHYPITECVVGDTIGLGCGIGWDPIHHWSNLPESVTARITTSKGDVEFVKLFEHPYVGYLDVYPPPPRNFIVHIPNEDMYHNLPEGFLSFNNNLRLQITLECNPKDGILSVSPDGDVLRAEIKNKGKTLKAILDVRSK
jgi:hypothetical protein